MNSLFQDVKNIIASHHASDGLPLINPDKLEELIKKSQKMQETTGKKVARSFIYKKPPDGLPP